MQPHTHTHKKKQNKKEKKKLKKRQKKKRDKKDATTQSLVFQVMTFHNQFHWPEFAFS